MLSETEKQIQINALAFYESIHSAEGHIQNMMIFDGARLLADGPQHKIMDALKDIERAKSALKQMLFLRSNTTNVLDDQNPENCPWCGCHPCECAE